MKFVLYLISAVFLCISFAFPVKGQRSYSFNFNIENGLPSNHTYDVITDKLGYLWIATQKGVARYNGYEFRIFNLSDGLPTEDIWGLKEDQKGKIWLASISDEYGYLFNNVYHKGVVNGISSLHNTIYPRGIKRIGNNILFISSYLHGDGSANVCIERDDTIFSIAQKDFDRSIDQNKFKLCLPRQILIDDHGLAYFNFDDCMYQIVQKGDIIEAKKVQDLDSSLKMTLDNNILVTLGSYAITYSTDSNILHCKNVFTGVEDRTDLTKHGMHGDIRYGTSEPENKMYDLISDSNILQFKYDHGIKYSETFNINDLISDRNIDGSKIRTIFTSGLWGRCLCTTNNGLWVSSDIKNNFVKEERFDFHEYKFVGIVNDSSCFLWNGNAHSLAIINSKFQIRYFHYKEIENLRKVTYYHGDTLLFTGSFSYFFVNKDHKKLIKNDRTGFLEDVYSTIMEGQNRLYIINRLGFSFINMRDIDGRKYILDHDKYYYLLFDTLRRNYWAYNNDKIFIHKQDRDTVIPSDQFFHFGVGKITKIVIDNKYGNIFFNGSNSITMYDPEKDSYQELFKNINAKESSIFIYRDLLIVAGQFGVLFSKIQGRQQISEPTIFPNLKNSNYRYIYDCEVMFGKLLLNTDKGTYEVAIPTDDKLAGSKPEDQLLSYKFIVSYRDTASNFKSGDTITINQNFRRLQFDVIKPFGNGHAKYTYRFSNDTGWSELNANELSLPPKFIPGSYYKLYLKVYDNVWRSDDIVMYIYIYPYWWQTPAGRRFIWSLAITGVIFLLTISVLLTRKLVLQSTKKRSLRMELELKSLYAQINPHFIFNTLNSALFMVRKNKMAEADIHISKFSKLLRSYLDSSRSKLISIGDEVTNLKNYIELQQVRFSNIFDYTIQVDDTIDTMQVMIPSLLVQPFVENAINHGLFHKGIKGHLGISFKKGVGENSIVCTITDDGVGRSKSKEIEAGEHKTKSYGDELIKDLVRIFKTYEKMDIEIKYTDVTEPHSGTIVEISIKNTTNGK